VPAYAHNRRQTADSLQRVILFASYSGAFGGAERLLVQFASGLEAECALACPEGPLAVAAREAGLRVLPVARRRLELRASLADRALSPGRLAAHGRELRRLARNVEPDLVVAWGMRSALAWALLSGLGGLLSRPSRPGRFAFQHNDLLLGRAIGFAVRAVARRAVLVTAPSRTVACDLDPRGRLGVRLQVIHPGVDADRFDQLAAPVAPPEVLVLGALTGWKRPDLALEAAAIARRSLLGWRLRFVGAPLDDAGRALVRRLRSRASEADLAGAVQFAGPSEDPPADLARASCLLHCADAEPFGIAVLEALAAARPAVVPASGGSAEIVDGSCGRLYPPGDAAAAALALVEVLNDPARAAALGRAGRARARERFDGAAARTAYAEALAPWLVRRASDVPRPSLAIVTVTHNSAAELKRLAASVRRHLPGARLIIVDSASSDGTLAVARSLPGAVTVALDRNVGFGAGCNRGLEAVAQPMVALLNPDVELIDDSLLELAEEALDRARPERLLAPLVLDPDGSRQDTVHPLPGSPADLARALVPPALTPGTALAPWGARKPRPVGWAVGAALVARADTLRRLGPFDEQIFMYGEDLDLGLRAADAGIPTWFWPSARVVHARAHAAGPAFGAEPFERLAQARREVVARRLGRSRARLDDAAQITTFATRIVAKRVLGRSAARERRQLGALTRVRRPDGPA
jgi:N-acetylglucosaminyl-diphospho-decaprenol L-rhamnosyltransferase